MKRVDFGIFPWTVVFNILIVYVCYEICRLAFLLENWQQLSTVLTWHSFYEMSVGGLLFDTSAICFTNCFYLLLILLPIYQKRKIVSRITKIFYIVPNAICVVINLMDSVYFSYTQRRVTANVFSEFKNEDNLGRIFCVEFLGHWYLVVLATLLIVLMFVTYKEETLIKQLSKKKYIIRQIVCALVIIPLAISGMRGAMFRTATRPITVSNALQYVDQPIGTNVVLNTTFNIIKTVNNKPFVSSTYFQTQKELLSIYTPVHKPKKGAVVRKKNVVILIVESFGEEFVGSRNKDLDGGRYKGYTPFIDSLLKHSLTYRETFCNTWTSIDAMPAVLASIPKMHEPFVLTSYSLNKINSIASELNKWGYYTAFFHGAENNSMGFHAFARSAGFKAYFGRDEFDKDPNFNGEKDFDGTWGIWDEPFLQYFCQQMGRMKEPFMTAVFTLSSHHPFAIPEKYKGVFKDEGLYPLHKCIRYTDYSIKEFFKSASKQPWYKNTIFVITADHASSKITHAEYKTELGHFRVPIIFYDPSGDLPIGCQAGVAQQIDIMPTILNYLGYDKPYVAFGKDLFNTSVADTWAFNYFNIPQLIKGNYLLQFDGTSVVGMYNYKHDKLLKNNLKGKVKEELDMKKQIEGIMQSYSERMQANNMTIK